MNLLSKFLLWTTLSLFVAFGAKAQEMQSQDVQTTDALFCSSADQVKQFVTQHESNLEAAIAAVNDQHDSKSPCLSAGIAFVPGKEIGRIEHQNATLAVTEITIVGVATPYGILAIHPNVAYTILKVKDVGA